MASGVNVPMIALALLGLSVLIASSVSVPAAAPAHRACVHVLD